MVCPECSKEKGCGCTFLKTAKRDYKVCPYCKVKIDSQILNVKNDHDRPTTPNVQGV